MAEWQVIDTALDQLPFEEREVGGRLVRYYRDALVYGPTWEGGWHRDYPDGDDLWTGEPRAAIAHTWSGKGFWTIMSEGPSDYDTHIKPTHWMPLPEPPNVR